MTLGEQLKKLRNDRGLSQPELAELSGIEQSYLSKLENDKSMPSNDIFRQLLKALKLELTVFLALFELTYIRQQLTSIADIEYWLLQQDKQKTMSQRRYLYSCSILIVIAITLFYVGFSKQNFSETRYQYESQGVILPGEPKDVFNVWMALVTGKGDEHRIAMKKKRIEMTQRGDTEIYLTAENFGQQFVMDVTGGTRVFRLDKEEQIPRSINAWLQMLGVMFFSAGIMGFVLERRFYK